MEQNAASLYRRSGSVGSFLWSMWLRMPSNWRGQIYRILLRLFGQKDDMSYVYRLPFGLFAKFCRMPDEAYVTEFVRMNTTIPVPQVMDILHVPYTSIGSIATGRSWLMISTALPGTPLFIFGKGHRLLGASEAQVDRVKAILAEWIAQLRQLQSPYGQRICGFLGGQFVNYRIGGEPVGPYHTAAEFHAQPFCIVAPTALESASPQALQNLEGRKTKVYKTTLTHGDLVLHNVLADADCRPTGLIDWECSGWLPDYWETVSSRRAHFNYMWCWKDIVRDAFPKHEVDFEVDSLIQRTWDCY